MGDCQVCGKSSHLISGQLGTCLNCIREKPEETSQITDNVHTRSRALFDLPPSPPNSQDGILCGVCANNCRLSIGEKG